MRHRVAALVTTALALVVTSLATGGPAAADEQGFAVTITQAPETFTVGRSAREVIAVVRTDRPRCRNVRWALAIRTDGVSLRQVRVNRIEEGQPFAVRTQVDGDTAQLVDAQFDPGQLCGNRQVTARWQIGFTGPDDGEVRLEARAFDATGRLLSRAETGSRVVTAVAATPSPSASPTDEPTDPPPSEEPTDEPTEADTVPAGNTSTTQPTALTRTGSSTGVLGPGLIVGAVLVFLGVGLLLRLRSRARARLATEEAAATEFYYPPQ